MSSSFVPPKHLNDNLHMSKSVILYLDVPFFNSLKCMFSMCHYERFHQDCSVNTVNICLCNSFGLFGLINFDGLEFMFVTSKQLESNPVSSLENWLQYYLSSDGPLENTGNVGL